MMLRKNTLVLFQGDSITDCGRDYNDEANLGNGYAAMTAKVAGTLYPELALRFINKGVSGNRVTHLEERWGKDTVSYKPDVLTILIGINDTHLSVADKPNSPSFEEFENILRQLLLDAKKQAPDIRIIMLEPFLIPSEHESAAWSKPWRMDLMERIILYRKLAVEMDVEYIPTDGLFMSAYSHDCPPEFWSLDGVHPTVAGHRLIAAALLRKLGIQL